MPSISTWRKLRKYKNTFKQVRTQDFSLWGEGGGANPEAICNLCLILKIMLYKSCHKYNITLSATAFIYI
jgi:hypothetical protein